MTKPSGSFTFKVYCDGGSRGNPGPSAIGFLVKNQTGDTVHTHHQLIGQTTNNVAEYQAVIAALKWLVKYPATQDHATTSIQFFLDSKLVVNQINGNFKVKDNRLRDLFATAQNLQSKISAPLTFTAIPRDQNSLADSLVNQALDEHTAS